MVTNTKIVVAILTIIIQRVYNSQVLTLSEESDDENTLKQALYLVKLLKSDHMKSLRANGELEINSEEVNSTCPEELHNATIPLDMNNSSASTPQMVTPPPAMLVPTMTPVIPQPAVFAPHQPPPPPPQLPAALQMGPAPAVMTSLPIYQNVPPGNIPLAENYKYPYRFYRRRMMPDYYYYDVLLPRYSKNSPHYARAVTANRGMISINEPVVDHFIEKGPNNQSAKQSFISGYRRAGDDLNPIETGTTATDKGKNVSEVEHTALISATQESQTLTTINATELQTTLLEVTKLQSNDSVLTLVSTSPEAITSAVYNTAPHRTNTNRRQIKTSAVAKAHSKYIKKIKSKNIRHLKTIAQGKPAGEDVVLSQVASELINEFKGTKSQNISAMLRNNIDKNLLKNKPKTVTQKGTMKIYLQGSTRIQIPFPENNAFCHLYPQSKLCGAGI